MLEFKNRLQMLRNKNNFSLDELAERVKLSRMTISRYENGKIEPKLENLQKIAECFNVTVDYLIGNETNVLKNLSQEFTDLDIISIGVAKEINELSNSQKKLILDLVRNLKEDTKG